MPKIRASMSDVSTDFSPLEPGVYRFEIKEVTEHEIENTSRVYYSIKSEAIAIVSDGNEKDIGRSITDRVHIHLKTGEINEFGLAQLKRYFEVTLGDEEANDDEADTDWLIGQQFLGQVEIESYKVDNRMTGESEERKRNVISALAPVG